jgi:hypothetical protein
MDLTKDFDELGLAKPTDKGAAPRERLTTPARLRNIHVQFREDDRVNAFNRSRAQALLDGEPPYDDEDIADSPDTTNLNFFGAEEQLERAKTPYDRLLNSGENLLSVKTLYGPEDERPDWEEIMDEEISETIRTWEDWPCESDMLVHKHVWEALAVAHWTDDTDWRFKASGQGKFFFPRGAAITESRQDIVTCEGEMTITELWGKAVKDEKDPDSKWCREIAIQAIQKATNAQPPYQDWERLMEEVKNNDLYVGTRLPGIRVIHGFVKEFNGKVSHYIVPETPCDDEHKFMYCSRQVYASMGEAFVLFPYGKGTNLTIHGLRGLGYKIYPFEQQLNRSRGRLIDKGFEGSSTMVQATDETDMANLGLTYFGNMAVLPPGITVPNVTFPDLQRSVMPAIEMMESLRNNRTAGYSSENVFDGDQRKTKAEVMAHLEQSASLSDSSINFFCNPEDRLFRQMVRRMTAKGYHPSQPGGEEVSELKLRLVKRGVPLEAFHRIDWKRVKAVRVIGAGSSAAKTLGLQRMTELRPRMDDVGQKNLDRELAIDAVGVAGADKFFPRDGEFRTTAETQIAILQNAQLMQGIELPVLSSDGHMAHAREHIKPMMEDYELVAGGQIPEAEFAQKYILLYPHTAEHVGKVEGDITVSEEAAAMRQMLQRIEEFINNGIKELEAQQQEAAENPQEQAPGEPSLEEAQAYGKAQAEVEAMRMKTAAQIEMDDRKTDAQIAREARKNEAKVGMDDAKTAAEIRRKNFAAKAAPKKEPAKKTAKKK